ncbi:hypothetical protein A2U01_0053819, partial [Trifolium medium]|nr:hypothetical protein [Trifolium medium]
SALKLLNGCDYYHRLVIMQAPVGEDLIRGEPEPVTDEIIDSYVKALAEIVER